MPLGTEADACRAASTPPLEIALGVLGGSAVLFLAGFLLFAALRGEGRGDPEVRVELQAARRFEHGWLVPFRAVNGGQAPASQLRLEALLKLADGRQLQSEATIDYLAGHSEQEGGFYFLEDPATGLVSARPLGFVRP